MVSARDCANALRFLSVDAVQKANSGHPGMPLGMADIAEVLFRRIMKFDPKSPTWHNRDRFILSNGHGSMLLYSALHLAGYDLSMEDLQSFRQLHSKTPGHPEHDMTPGVETTTGPLGQGLANAVGMALVEKHLAAIFNRPEFPMVNHYTYVFVGDGCLMEGISHEVCSLAGTLKLGKLIVIYDDNGISIDGEIKNWFTDNTPKRFEAYGWQVIENVDGHDSQAIERAIQSAQDDGDRPSLICCKTTIGYGVPGLQGKAITHGSPLGDSNIQALRQTFNWAHAPFFIPDNIRAAWDRRQSGERLRKEWETLWSSYQRAYPELAQLFLQRMQKTHSKDWDVIFHELISKCFSQTFSEATRKSSQHCLDVLSKHCPELFGGSADLTESNCTIWKGADIFSADAPEGNYLHFGVREFGMSAILNGMALYGGVIPFAGTFLTFSDYARNAIRMAALMKIQSIFIYSHDSIGLGEDGPTHQPIEHLPSLRLIPGLSVWRPANLLETMTAWKNSIEYSGPSCLVLSRQNILNEMTQAKPISEIERGAYIIWENTENPEMIFLATGSEVALACVAAKRLAEENISVRVISMPCLELFQSQDADYQNQLLPISIHKRLVIEAAASGLWYRYVGEAGAILGIDRFGASAPAQAVYADCGLTEEAILGIARRWHARTEGNHHSA